MRVKVLAMMVVATTVLSGCGMFGDDGMFRNRSKDYLLAEESPPIVVPEGMDSDGIGQLYHIPPIAETAILDNSSGVPRPQPLSESNLEEIVKIQSLGGGRWILTNRGPSEVWPRVRNILNRSGIPAVKAEASQGLIETGWLEFKGDDAFNHRYRFYIQPGVQVNSTEIKTLHDQVAKESEEDSPWPAQSVDDGREKDMVEILANALAGDVSSGTVSLLAQTIGGDQKVEIITPKVADAYLLMKLDYERSWASVAYSLQRGGFTTIDQDQSGGVFYANYTPEDQDEPGFFSRWFSGNNEILETNYLVLLTKTGDGVQVRVVDNNRSSLERSDAIRLLTGIRANLS